MVRKLGMYERTATALSFGRRRSRSDLTRFTRVFNGCSPPEPKARAGTLPRRGYVNSKRCSALVEAAAQALLASLFVDERGLPAFLAQVTDCLLPRDRELTRAF